MTRCARPQHREVRTTRFRRAPGLFVGVTSRCNPMRPPPPRLAYRDDRAYAPHAEAGWREISTFSEKTKQKNFPRKDWTGRVTLNSLAISAFWRILSEIDLPESDLSGFARSPVSRPIDRLDRLYPKAVTATLGKADSDEDQSSRGKRQFDVKRRAARCFVLGP
ncbi:hypothetical protein BRAS3843_1240009 [Bradyrhizobium sp. STM 3843]|nr:hypothetical protein BRAS3843_1240009 [Bradyrhizobium sp. STM 3843]